MNRIIVLPPQEARRIAAGEVIERPSSALRELIDNAIDAKASHITIHLKAGGIEEITIIDNGIGMDKEDLTLCIVSHATSKIQRVEDLDHLATLGFRGEALASLTSCAKVEIISKKEAFPAHRLLAYDGAIQSLQPTAHPIGTTIHIKELFYNIPVRKRFLKSIASEAKDSLLVIYEKSLAHPHIAFTVTMDGKEKLHLPVASLAQRAATLYSQQLSNDPLVMFSEQTVEKDGFSLQIIASPPHLHRSDKRYIHFYANGRRIIEYAPIQALMHAYDAVLPGGQYPSGFIFAQIRPDLVDFNIHPAKREAKFRNMPLIHRSIIDILQTKLIVKSPASSTHHEHIFRPLSLSDQLEPQKEKNQAKSLIRTTKNTQDKRDLHPHQYSRITTQGDPIASFLQIESNSTPNKSLVTSLSTHPPKRSEVISQPQQSWYYLGQIFGVFLLVERGSVLYLIDQHAAHERILFDQICQAPPKVDRLLYPLTIELSTDQLMLIQLAKEELLGMGIEFTSPDDTHIELHSTPSDGNSVAFWQEYLLNLEKGLKKTMYATLACRQAIKEGDYLDDQAAMKLIQDTFTLDQPFCPHGRPLWIELTQDQLYKWIKRTI
ncbi:DNA mismatch repair endonuclease MutL [Entomospira entomophila]|uniref:DNA mismatch repair protein MutL n=1 Tax=Entomospira entomophila TaxID=2719988 RepID=A0A968KRD4_9SPIO|nr:DNA mismatch repair endonuclease MutL [Entomospira entomophilus]NIZ40633.1 DNA mismatch repair endonuclease MutL [Entomospira entomophilus]WDI34847.1 DNA mismatch repair endonuclease MutL [Entomospira entomophilus]